jgi:acetyltransferase
VYDLLHEKMNECKKPIYPILPSIINVKDEIEHFLAKGRVNFPDEVVFGNALAKVYHTPAPQPESIETPKVDEQTIRSIIDGADNGYLMPDKVQQLLDAAGITRAGEAVVTSADAAKKAAAELGYPVVMKVVGPVHKSDVGGVVLNVKTPEAVVGEFERMIKIKDTTAILIQPMLSGVELFVGAKREDKFGHLVLCGLGGIFIEVLKDVNAGITPIAQSEALDLIHRLKSYKILQGLRGQEPVNDQHLAEIVTRVSALVTIAPEIFEMDLNPLLGRKDKVVAVDARIRIEK